MEKKELNQTSTAADSDKKPSESTKRQRVSSMIQLIEEKAKRPPIRFVVDVDNIGAVENICQFFKGYDVHVTFFVKNQTGLGIPNDQHEESRISFDIVHINKDSDDDLAALTEALNTDCFIISCDKFRTYTKSGLIDEEWLESHRVECFWKNAGNNSTPNENQRRLNVAIPLHLLPPKKESTKRAIIESL